MFWIVVSQANSLINKNEQFNFNMQTLKNCLIIIAILMFQQSVYSQKTDSLKLAYNNGTIYRYGGAFMKGNERVTFKDLEHEFDFSELGRISYDKAKRTGTTARILLYASMAANLGVLAFLANNNRNGAYVSFGVQLALVAGSGSYRRQSMQYLDRALWQRNKDYLFPGQ